MLFFSAFGIDRKLKAVEIESFLTAKPLKLLVIVISIFKKFNWVDAVEINLLLKRYFEK